MLYLLPSMQAGAKVKLAESAIEHGVKGTHTVSWSTGGQLLCLHAPGAHAVCGAGGGGVGGRAGRRVPPAPAAPVRPHAAGAQQRPLPASSCWPTLCGGRMLVHRALKNLLQAACPDASDLKGHAYTLTTQPMSP